MHTNSHTQTLIKVDAQTPTHTHDKNPHRSKCTARRHPHTDKLKQKHTHACTHALTHAQTHTHTKLYTVCFEQGFQLCSAGPLPVVLPNSKLLWFRLGPQGPLGASMAPTLVLTDVPRHPPPPLCPLIPSLQTPAWAH